MREVKGGEVREIVNNRVSEDLYEMCSRGIAAPMNLRTVDRLIETC
jgi:hypothetical protein